MQQRFAQQMKKGALDMLVLKLLEHEEKYGYQLIGELRERSGGTVSLKEGTLYPILYRLEDDGFISSSWQTGGTARTAPKKIYTATAAGRSALAAMQAEWSALCECVQACRPVLKPEGGGGNVPA